MATNRTRVVRSVGNVEPWIIEFLMTGTCTMPDGTPSKRHLLFEDQFDGCLANNWKPVWGELQGEVLKVWRAGKRGGVPWALRHEND